MIPNFIFKQRAWAAIKPWLQLLVVIGLLAGIVTDLSYGFLDPRIKMGER